MRILGVDPALTTTGWGIVDFDKNKLSFSKAGIITTSPRQTLDQRLDKIHTQLMKLVSETKPDVMVLEKLFAHYRHPTTAYLLGQARGVICLICAKKNIPLVEYAATRVKKAIVGAGLASKAQVQRMVAHILNLNNLPRCTDISDALALAIAHSYNIRVKNLNINFKASLARAYKS